MASCQLTKQKIAELSSVAIPHIHGHHYNEFVVELPGAAADCLSYLDTKGIIGGFDLSRWYPERKNWLLITATDQNTSAEVELLVAHLAAWSSAKIQGLSA
jgi:glycine dehydrogenase subunit 1